MMFSKPEVEALMMKRDQSKYHTVPANLLDKRGKALVIIQKFIRGYITRNQVQRLKDIKELLDQKDKSEDSLKNDVVGRGLKLSDLSVQNKNQLSDKMFKRNTRKTEYIGHSNENSQDLASKSKLDNTQSFLYDFMKRGNKNKLYNTSKILELEESKRDGGNRRDNRDLDDKEMNIIISESPLRSNAHEDDVTIISSRIDTNKKQLHNTTMDIISSSRKAKIQREESLRVLQTIKKNKHPRTNMAIETSDIKDMSLKHEIIIE